MKSPNNIYHLIFLTINLTLSTLLGLFLPSFLISPNNNCEPVNADETGISFFTVNCLIYIIFVIIKKHLKIKSNLSIVATFLISYLIFGLYVIPSNIHYYQISQTQNVTYSSNTKQNFEKVITTTGTIYKIPDDQYVQVNNSKYKYPTIKTIFNNPLEVIN